MSKYHKTHRFTIFIITFGIIFFAIGCNEINVKSHWVSQPIAVDGHIDDWEDLPVSYFKDKDAVIALCNDSSNLYLQFRTKNASWARTIKMSGLTVYFDPNGKKNKDFYLKFTGGPNNSVFHEIHGADSAKVSKEIPPEMRDRMRERMQERKPVFTCFEKKRYLDKEISMNGDDGPAVGFGSDYGFFIYEFSVPLHKSTVNNYGIEATPGQKMSVGLVWGDMKDFRRDNRPHNFDRGEGMRDEVGEGFEGGEGGEFPDGDEPMGGGRPEGGRMPGRGGHFQRPEKQEIWIKTTLASETGANPLNNK